MDGQRSVDRALVEAGYMPLNDYLKKWDHKGPKTKKEPQDLKLVVDDESFKSRD